MVRRVGVGANYFRWGQLEYLKRWQYFGVSGIYTARSVYCEYSQYLDVLLILFTLSAKKHSFRGNTFCVLCWNLLSRSQSIM